MAKTRSKSSNIKKPTSVKPPRLKVSIAMNGEVYVCRTSNLKQALLDFAPTNFKSKVVITVSNKVSTVQRVMMIHRAKQLFRSEVVMDVFVKNILLGLKNV